MEQLLSDIIKESKIHHKKDPLRFECENTKSPFSKLEDDRSSSIILYKLRRYANEVNDQSEKLDKLVLSDIGKMNINDIYSSRYYNNMYYKYQTLISPKNNTINLKKTIKPKTKNIKCIFKDNLLLAEKIKKTKIKEFSFSSSKKKKKPKSAHMFKAFDKNKNNEKNKNKNISKFYPRTKSAYLSPKITTNKKINFNNNNRVSSFTPKSNDGFFITKLSISPLNNSRIKSSNYSKAKNLKKLDKIFKQSNKSMLDIYNGLKYLNDNYNNYYYLNQISENNNQSNNKINTQKNKKSRKCRSANYINKKFKKLFQEVYENKKYSNQKIDARQLLEPLEEYCGLYKEVKLDNNKNNKIGQRIWIKRSTANLLSFGKSFQLISDSIFNREKKRITRFYPKIMKDCDLRLPYRSINKVNPDIAKIKENISRIKDIFANKYNLLKRIHSKYN